MHDRALVLEHPPQELVLRTRPNWTVVGFFAALGAMHLLIAIPGFIAGRWEGYLSFIFAIFFVLASAIATQFRFELKLFTRERRLRLRIGVGRFCTERFVPYSAIQGVRLTMIDGSPPEQARIELLCPYEDMECPPTKVPRQEALLLAMLLNVPLVKVYSERCPAMDAPEPSRRELAPEDQE